MNNLLAATLDENLQGIVTKLQSLMDSFWIYIVMAVSKLLSLTKTKRKLMPAIWLKTLSSVS